MCHTVEPLSHSWTSDTQLNLWGERTCSTYSSTTISKFRLWAQKMEAVLLTLKVVERKIDFSRPSFFQLDGKGCSGDVSFSSPPSPTAPPPPPPSPPIHHLQHLQSNTLTTFNPPPSAPSPSSPPPPTPPSSSPPPSSSSPTPPPSSPPPPHHLDWLRTRVRACEEGKEVWWSDRFGWLIVTQL